ncbi:glycosyltransferase family 4 protein [Symbiopectobacterium sp. RP]|uniref:glycosyltransferase family 4 protein n=1 Tax=Symbiopectobacterium sp. RP TaxID=3248553 RepID=UPI003D2B92D8
MRIKILFYCKDFYPMHNGYANAYKYLLDSLSKARNYDLTVFTTTDLLDCQEINIDDVVIIRENALSKIKYIRYVLNAKKIAQKLNFICKQKKIDLLFIESGDEPLIIRFLDKKILPKTIVRYHSTSDTEYTEFFPGINNKINKFIQKTIIPSYLVNYCSTNDYHINFLKKSFLKDNEYLISNKNFFKIPNTLNIDIKTSSDVFKKKKKIFILGRMNKEGFLQKGFKDILYALSGLKKSDLNGYSFLIVGDGIFYEKIEKMFLNSAISESVSIVRQMLHCEVLSYLSESRAVILASRFEGHSMFALEAIASGCIGLFSKAGALPLMVPNDRFLFNTQDSFDLLQKIKIFLNLDDDEIEKCCIEHSKWFENNFSQSKVLEYFDHAVSCINEK